jgi:hypothetical protein
MDNAQRRAVRDVLETLPEPKTRKEARASLMKTGVWRKDGTLTTRYGGGKTRQPEQG